MVLTTSGSMAVLGGFFNVPPSIRGKVIKIVGIFLVLASMILCYLHWSSSQARSFLGSDKQLKFSEEKKTAKKNLLIKPLLFTKIKYLNATNTVTKTEQIIKTVREVSTQRIPITISQSPKMVTILETITKTVAITAFVSNQSSYSQQISKALLQNDDRCPAYTYFEHLEVEPKIAELHFGLLRLWLRNMYSKGHLPIILSREHARLHRNYPTFLRAVQALPTINDASYEESCYVRWLAFAAVGGGLFVDYDIYALGPWRVPPGAGKCGEEGQLRTYLRFFPMITYSSPKHLQSFIDIIRNYKPHPERDRVKGEPHVSDMLIAANNSRIFRGVFDYLPPAYHFSGTSLNLHHAKSHLNIGRVEWPNSLLRIHALNTKKIYTVQEKVFAPLGKYPFIADSFDCMLDSESDIQRLLPTDANSTLFLPNEQQKCNVFQVSALSKINMTKSDDFYALAIIDVQNYYSPSKNIHSATFRLSEKIFGKDASKEQIQAYISNPRVILGLSTHLVETRLLLEFTLGFILPEIPASRNLLTWRPPANATSYLDTWWIDAIQSELIFRTSNLRKLDLQLDSIRHF